MATAQFALSEGTLNVPDAYQDRSINVLKFKETNATLVITRAWDIKPGEEENFLNQQLAKVKRSMRKVVMDAIEDSSVGGAAARAGSLGFGKCRCVSKTRAPWCMRNLPSPALTTICWC